ncbi:MAG: STAS domain-containing protein [Cyclobacteriaceae bacterium]|nr:STAS domain-containing protein [Cyclobacteriaceae bacterium]
MKYSADKQEKYVIIELNEEKLDTTIAPELKSEFVTLQAEGFQHVILNLTNTKYSDSSGLSALLVGNRLFSENGSFILCGIQEHVSKLIGISQLDKVLDILPTQEEAIDAVFMNDLENNLKSESEEDL